MFGTIGPQELLVILLVGTIVGLVPMLAFWRIFSKAGYPGVLAITMLVPGVNVIMVFFLAFSEWPVLKELEGLRRKSPPTL